MGAKIINKNNPTNGSTNGSKQDLEKIETIAYPTNFSPINQHCMNLPPAVVKDLENNKAYFFNDFKKTNSLVNVILEADTAYKSLPEENCSREIIEKIDVLFKQWLKDEEQKHKTGSVINSIEQTLVLAYGSYELGVQDKNSDLDLMCIAPESEIRREDWIKTFCTVLNSENDITDVQAIPTARIPIIKLVINNQEVELAFVQLKIKNIPKSLKLHEDFSLEGLDYTSQRTLNARHATHKILQMVPNVKLFRFTLRAIRLWAKRNGLYGNKLRYIGGISWAILVAKTCLLYPRMDAARLIHKFFFMYANWEWPKSVYLVDPDKPKGKCHSISFHLCEGTHLMPILTPTFPQENSAYNVTTNNRDSMKMAFSRAYCTVDSIMTGKAAKCQLSWQKFFEESDFINRYHDFIVVFAHSFAGAQHHKWRKHIEFKLVNFLRALEQNPLLMPCVDTMSYRPKNLEKEIDCSIWFIGLANPPLSYARDNLYELCRDTKERMTIFEQLSSNQAKRKGFGDVQLQVEYMSKEDCITILQQDLEISNKR